MKLERFGLIVIIATGILASLAVEAQPSRKVFRVGVLSDGSPEDAPYVFALRDGLHELGYIGGQNITIEWRWARRQQERLPELARELASLRLNAVVAEGSLAVSASRRAAGAIPIVMVNVGDAVRQGFVASLPRPGGNITGLSSQTTDLQGKRLDLFKEAIPRFSRVATLQDSSNPEVGETEVAARALGVRVLRAKVASPGELDGAFAAFTRDRAQGVVVEASRLFILYRARIQRLAADHRLPTMCPARYYDCLMSYGVNWSDRFRQAARYVDKILKGTKPADLPWRSRPSSSL